MACSNKPWLCLACLGIHGLKNSHCLWLICLDNLAPPPVVNDGIFVSDSHWNINWTRRKQKDKDEKSHEWNENLWKWIHLSYTLHPATFLQDESVPTGFRQNRKEIRFPYCLKPFGGDLHSFTHHPFALENRDHFVTFRMNELTLWPLECLTGPWLATASQS